VIPVRDDATIVATLARSGVTINAGEELWGFVPPALLGRLESATASHQFMVDGTPVVRDMFYSRAANDLPSANAYHTTLVTGLDGPT
jgi:Tfp pilus tip-associated adhesin PilY1